MSDYYYILVFFLANVITYLRIRHLLWSIVWLNKQGKYKKFKQFKKEVGKQQPILSRISMKYLLPYVKICRADFILWHRFKWCFCLIEAALALSLIFVIAFWRQASWFNAFELVILLQILLPFFFVRLFEDVHGTKGDLYDWMRSKRRKGK